MTALELRRALIILDDDSVVVLGDGTGGWANIEQLLVEGSTITIEPEKYPVFSEN